MDTVLEESYLESTARWYLYRRWRKKGPGQKRISERLFHETMRAAVPKRGLFIDCGANVGDVTAAALKYGMRVIAFEPDRLALMALQKRFAGDGRVSVIPKALGNSDRRAKFFQLDRVTNNIIFTQGSSLFQTDIDGGRIVHEVDVVDIVKFLNGIDERISILKMDIEGAEAECLEAILDSGLHRTIGCILVETHERFSEDLSARILAIRKRIRDERIENINLDWI